MSNVHTFRTKVIAGNGGDISEEVNAAWVIAVRLAQAARKLRNAYARLAVESGVLVPPKKK